MRYVEQNTEFETKLVAVAGLEGVTVSVVDTDPGSSILVAPTAALEDAGNPGRYSAHLTAPDAAMDGRGYSLVWALPELPTVVEDLIVTTTAPEVNIAALPGVSDVAALIRARTKNTHGREVGTFTDETRPRRGQVLGVIGIAQGDVASAVGFGVLPDGLARRAKTATAIRAAMLIELSYFPEQVAAGKSPYRDLKELYDDELERLARAAAADGVDVDGDGSADTATIPSYRVPDHCMTTFHTEF